MLHVFNRRELITVFSDRHLHRLQSALSSAGISYQIKDRTPPFTKGRYHGTPFINNDASHPCVIYVKTTDYERAKTAIQSVL